MTVLASHLPWQEVFGLLDLSHRGDRLPQAFTCPRCRGKAVLSEDGANRAQWYRCSSCEVKGDLVDLCSKVWKCSDNDSLDRLCSYGLLAEGVGKGPGRGEREAQKATSSQLDEIWAVAQKDLYGRQSQSANAVAKLVGVPPIDIQWPKRLGRFLGSVSVHDFIDATGVRNTNNQRGHKKIKTASPFKNIRTWEDAVCVPVQTARGRITGFYMAGRENREENADRVYWYPTGERRKNTERRPQGIGMLEALCDPGQPETKNPIADCGFVFHDAQTALLLQMRHMRVTNIPLPIGFVDPAATTEGVWDQIPHKKLYVVGNEATPSLLRHAHEADAYVVVTDVNLKDKHIRHGRAILSGLAGQAKDWRDMLVDLILRRKDDNLISELRLTPGEWKNVMEGRSDAVQRKVRQRIRTASAGVPVAAGINTDSDGNWVSPSGSMICNAPFVVEKVIIKGDQKFAEGVIYFKDQEIRFETRFEPMRRKTSEWLEDTVMRAGVGIPVVTRNKKLSPAIYSAAVAGKEPLIEVRDPNKVWDGKKISLPYAAISAGEDHRTLTQECVDLFSRHTATAAAGWFAIAATTRSVLANSVPHGEHGSWLVAGAGVQSLVETTLQSFGGRVHTVRNKHLFSIQEQVSQAVENTGLPLFIRPEGQGLYEHQCNSAYRKMTTGEMAKLPWMTNANFVGARVGALLGHGVYEDHLAVSGIEEQTKHAPAILYGYLRDVVAGGNLIGHSKFDVDMLLFDMKRWFKEQGGGNRGIRLAMRNLGKSPKKDHTAFLEACQRLVSDGRMAVQKKGFQIGNKHTRRSVVILSEDVVQVRMHKFNKEATAAGGIDPELQGITAALAEGGAIDYSLPEADGLAEWHITREAWDKTCENRTNEGVATGTLF